MSEYESCLTYIQKNLDLIENFIKELKHSEELDEQRYKIFQFMLNCFHENSTAKTSKFKKLLGENKQRHVQNVKQQLEQQSIKNAVENITQLLFDSPVKDDNKKIYHKRLFKINVKLLEEACRISKTEITYTEIKYIICFSIHIPVKDICQIFNVEVNSVYKARYRIRKKIAKEDAFRTIL